MSFLSSLATTLLNTYGTDLSQVTVVFPNKRASLFLNEQLAQRSDQPIWSPAYITISDLFRSLSSLEVADPIKLICDLHKSFVKCTGIEETLDHFYGWGQILLSDFDDVDKHLAPADKVFANLRDIHEFDNDSYLTPQQREIIRKFFSIFNEDHNTELKQRFLSLWSHIYDIYLDFNACLAAQGLAYEGALYRKVIEKYTEENANAPLDQTEGQYPPFKNVLAPGPEVLSSESFDELASLRQHLMSISLSCFTSQESKMIPKLGLPLKTPSCGMFFDGGILSFSKQYVFAGFNLLQPVEQALIDLFGDNATVVYDTDEETPKKISIISAPTENIQARYVSTWLKENNRIEAGSKTAIVLADESLLQTVIHSIPPEVTKLNITTGYPLSQTSAAAQGTIDFKGQVSFFPKRPGSSCLLVRNVLGRKDLPLDSPLELEALYRLELILNRLQALIDSGDLQVSDATLQRLLTQIIASTTIPFHGEPLEGLQIMGVLETRNLDFDHILLLSCNEGNIPKGINDTSFIPYSIRKAYGLTTIDHKVAIYENYFRRLLQRATDVTLVYNNATNDGKTKEMSRFILQQMVESQHPITYHILQAGQTPKLHNPQPIPKTPEVMERLKAIQQLSPSALSRYLRCPLRFFYQDVCGLSELEEQEDDLIDNRIFGNIFHKAAHLLYSTFTDHDDIRGTNLSFENVLARITSSCGMFSERKVLPSVNRAVDEAIKLELFHIEDPTAKMPPLNGLQLINREVIIRYLQQLLEIDRHLAPFTILALETPLYADSGITIKVGGIVDRIDKITLPDGTERIRVVDYKTSNARLKPLPDIAAIFDPANIKYHSDYYLQAILYSLIVAEDLQKGVKNSPLKNILASLRWQASKARAPHEEARRAKTFFDQTEDSVVSFKKHSARGGTTSQDVFERNNTVVNPIPVSPCLLFIQHAGTDDYDPTLILGKTPITDVTEIKDEFMHHLNNLISDIFDPDTPFNPKEERTRCKSCPFHALCQS